MNRKPGAAVAGMTLVLLTAVLVSLSMGSVRVPVLSVLGQALGLCAQRTGEYATQAYILAQVRLPRICALPGFVDSKNEEKTERNAGYLVVSHSGGGMLRQGTRKGIRRTPANRGMRAHRIVKSLDISEDVCHGLCP